MFFASLGQVCCRLATVTVQRYISPDLTHFVGRKQRTLKAQYEVLTVILKSGVLKAKGLRDLTDLELGEPPAYVLTVKTATRLSRNETYSDSVVCFCDIPIGDLDIHMEKYSRFGLAFTKEFLLGVGATPVMYVPTTARPSISPFKDLYNRPVATTARAFDEFYKRYRRLAREFVATELEKDAPEKLKRQARQFRDIAQFLDIHVLSHLKFFDPDQADSDPDNFYMEREWRVKGNVKFELTDVFRIVVPESYSRQLRKDFPEYDGELVFGD
jgi:hypothetical protein